MNTKIISKCLDELGKESPDLSYIRGMLETLLEAEFSSIPQLPSTTDYPGQNNVPYRVPMMPYSMVHSNNLQATPSTNASSPESDAVDAALAMIGGIQPKPGVVTLEKNVILNT